MSVGRLNHDGARGQVPRAFWSISPQDLLSFIKTGAAGLTSEEARARLAVHGPNALTREREAGSFSLLLGQFKSPIVLILIVAAMLSYFLHDPTDALIILVIVFVSGLLGFWQERGAHHTLAKLLDLVKTSVLCVRDGKEQELSAEAVVPGDIILLSAGASIPADGLLLESKDLYVDEAALTGESFPAEKSVGVLPSDTPLARRANSVFTGTHVVSGTARAVAVSTGRATEFGAISDRLKLRSPETEFERGIRRFGYLLMEVTLILVLFIFAFNVFLARHVLESFLFSLALAVGLTPQLLPAIITINLAHGARRMAERKVIVKRLTSTENFGSMNVLCSDKTGTLTEGQVRLSGARGPDGVANDKVLLHAYLNAVFETGFNNPIDDAIRAHRGIDVSAYRKLDETPYDFIRRRLSVLVSTAEDAILITKGALRSVLEVCTEAELADGRRLPLAAVQAGVLQHFDEFSREGLRTLGVAYREAPGMARISREDEKEMVFLGYLLLHDPPKEGIAGTLVELNGQGVSLRIVTGDNPLVAARVAQEVGIERPRLLSGPEIRKMTDQALVRRVNDVDVFTEVEPNQKERIILAFKKAGNVVGYMGDGINDASALHAADVGISVKGATDVAKEAADIVLLENDLDVLAEGVREGRRTFANTLKYVFMATSANFGNMFSMAGASLFLPFLPLLPKQILLMNLLTDFPETAIATDAVDRELVERPRRWDIRFIRRFMLTFGLLSCIFDYLTFGVLLWVLHATEGQFRTGWFLESVISASLIVLVIRSRRPFFKSRPGRALLAATLLVVAVTLMAPITPLGAPFDFEVLPQSFLGFLAIIVGLYVFAAETMKNSFYRKAEPAGAGASRPGPEKGGRARAGT